MISSLLDTNYWSLIEIYWFNQGQFESLIYRREDFYLDIGTVTVAILSRINSGTN